MRASPLVACIVKELRLLRRDLHGLALLFVLPLAFILVMSLALQDLFAARAGHLADVLLIDRDRTEQSAALKTEFSKNESFGVKAADPLPTATDLQPLLQAGHYAVAIEIRAGYGKALEEKPKVAGDAEADAKDEAKLLAVTVASDTDKRTEKLLLAALAEVAARQRADQLIDSLPDKDPLGRKIDRPVLETSPVEVTYAYNHAEAEKAPTAVQQNVPAWLVFAVFFVAIPFSNTFIRERQLGTQRRLKTIDVGPLSQFFGKLIPYFAVNQLQVVMMLLVGVFVVPLLGGQALQLNGDPLAMALLSACISLAALGMALLIAVVAGTTEQATMLSGLGNILLAAIGGIMVPKFVMPEAMRSLADWSPMAWGLDGFLELLLRGGGVADIQGSLVRLAAFGVVTLGLAWLVHRVRE
jgi:ABC-2 type transport system permease protein